MLSEWTAAALAAALILYCVFGGADFGAGVLELVCGPDQRDTQRKVITRAMGPVWEANHMWLVLAIVILFCGFPAAYAQLSTQFHIPLTLMLIGVVLRGCAFTFRHYDAVQDRTSQRYYTGIFAASSLLTPCMLGMITGAILQGRAPGDTFVSVYVTPWCNLFCLSVGIFTILVFAFLAATYLIGEAPNDTLRAIFLRRARLFNGAAVLAGAAVFAVGQWDGLSLVKRFSTHSLSLSCMLLATALWVPLWMSLARGNAMWSRLLAAAQVALIVLGEFKLQFPVLVGSHTIYNAAAPDVTLQQILYALAVGGILIFPALGYLLKIFKGTPAS